MNLKEYYQKGHIYLEDKNSIDKLIDFIKKQLQKEPNSVLQIIKNHLLEEISIYYDPLLDGYFEVQENKELIKQKIIKLFDEDFLELYKKKDINLQNYLIVLIKFLHSKKDYKLQSKFFFILADILQNTNSEAISKIIIKSFYRFDLKIKFFKQFQNKSFPLQNTLFNEYKNIISYKDYREFLKSLKLNQNAEINEFLCLHNRQNCQFTAFPFLESFFKNADFNLLLR